MENNQNPFHQKETEFHGDYRAFSDMVDPFIESDEWIAAEVRQLFRAHHADDAKATEVALFYLKDYLTKTLHRHLKKGDRAWDILSDALRVGKLDWSSHRWFDGLYAEPEYLAPGHLRLRGRACWVQGQGVWYYDPFEFEIRLGPTTGAFQSYVMRFGDHRPLSDKESPDSISATPEGGWVYEFVRGFPNPDEKS